MKRIIPYSGGTDSYLMAIKYKPDLKVYIDYGAKDCGAEIAKLPIDVHVVQAPMLFTGNDYFSYLRNLYLLTEVLLYAINYYFDDGKNPETEFELITGLGLGYASGGAPDMDVDFHASLEKTLNLSLREYEGLPKIKVKVVNNAGIEFDKYETARALGVTGLDILNCTYSCYNGTNCMNCEHCLRRYLLAARLGANLGELIIGNLKNYLATHERGKDYFITDAEVEFMQREGWIK